MAAKKRKAAASGAAAGMPAADMQRFIMRMPKELHRQLRFLSVDRGVSLNSMIVDVLEAWWSKQPEHGKYPSA